MNAAGTAAGLVLLVLLSAGCARPWLLAGDGAQGAGCPGIPVASATLDLGHWFPIYPLEEWVTEGDLPLTVEAPWLPWPAVGLDKVRFQASHRWPMEVEGRWDGQVDVVVRAFASRIQWDGDPDARERFGAFVAAALKRDAPVANLSAEFTTVRSGGSGTYHKVTFAKELLDLDRLWNATAPRLERIGDDTPGVSGDTDVIVAGGDVRWHFGWVRNADWSQAGTVGQTATAHGMAYTALEGPLVKANPWGGVQVTVPGNDTAAARSHAQAWLAERGEAMPEAVELAVHPCGDVPTWPYGTALEAFDPARRPA